MDTFTVILIQFCWGYHVQHTWVYSVSVYWTEISFWWWNSNNTCKMFTWSWCRWLCIMLEWTAMLTKFIIVTEHECCMVSNHRQIDRSFRSWFILTTTTSSKLAFVRGTTVGQWIPLTMGQVLRKALQRNSLSNDFVPLIHFLQRMICTYPRIICVWPSWHARFLPCVFGRGELAA